MSKLLDLRKKLNITQEGLAKKANISVRTIQRIEAGKELKGHTLDALSNALGVSKEELMPTDTLRHETHSSLLRLINISSLFFIFIPFANILMPLVITWLKKAFNPITKQIISIQILWTLSFPLITLLAVFIGKLVNLNNQMLPIVLLLMLLSNAYVIVRNTAELYKKNELRIKLNFSIL